jgi:biotin operon repressor
MIRKPRVDKKVTPEAIMKATRANMSQSQLARELGVSSQAVNKAIKKLI